jgi:hypothetical protein
LNCVSVTEKRSGEKRRGTLKIPWNKKYLCWENGLERRKRKTQRVEGVEVQMKSRQEGERVLRAWELPSRLEGRTMKQRGCGVKPTFLTKLYNPFWYERIVSPRLYGIGGIALICFSTSVQASVQAHHQMTH